MAHGLMPASSAEIAHVAQAARGFLIDWDGCCAIDNQPTVSAVAFLRAHQERAAIVSNNSSNTVDDFLEILTKAGVSMRREQIVLAGVEAIDRAAMAGPADVMILADPRMRAVARNLGVRLNRDEAEIVVLLRDTRFSYSRLERAANALRKGARLIVANPDLTHPGAEGRVKPETGALLAALGACVNLDTVEMEIIGKPKPGLYLKACRALGLGLEDVVMLGDNPATDLAGAEALGMRALLTRADEPGVFEALLQETGF
ncbi:MAG: HAD-IA family hydrolase [Rhodobacterales bacterium]|nr:HAD-IA family hydrolase [Rhodobacterales bacterium]